MSTKSRIKRLYQSSTGSDSKRQSTETGAAANGVPSENRREAMQETSQRSPNSPDSEANDAGESSRDAEPLPLDSVFEILKNERRRETLKYLRENEGRVKLGELAEYIAAHENDTEVSALNSSERKRAYVGLYQCHLPKMNELGAVDFNRDRGVIEMGPHADQLFPYLDDSGEERPWSRYYLGLAVVQTVLLLGGLATGVLTGTLATLFSGLVVGSVGAVAIVHWWRTSDDEDE